MTPQARSRLREAMERTQQLIGELTWPLPTKAKHYNITCLECGARNELAELKLPGEEVPLVCIHCETPISATIPG